jgi:hypothetical protein
MAINPAAVASPPSAKPCKKRSTTRAPVAPTPAASYVGRKPIVMVANPMISIVASSTDFRPTTSPKWPKTNPPIGRATKPTAKVAKTAMVAAVGSNVGKKSRSKTKGAIRACLQLGDSQIGASVIQAPKGVWHEPIRSNGRPVGEDGAALFG